MLHIDYKMVIINQEAFLKSYGKSLKDILFLSTTDYCFVYNRRYTQKCLKMIFHFIISKLRGIVFIKKGKKA